MTTKRRPVVLTKRFETISGATGVFATGELILTRSQNFQQGSVISVICLRYLGDIADVMLRRMPVAANERLPSTIISQCSRGDDGTLSPEGFRYSSVKESVKLAHPGLMETRLCLGDLSSREHRPGFSQTI
jgi:hypothetical protein